MYVELTDLAAEIPPQFLTQALDDNGDGVADEGAWDAIAAKACEDVDSLLAGRFNVPFTALIPPLVKRAARIFALEKLYLKRGIAENPWTKQAAALRDQLAAIGRGEQPLHLPVQRGKPSASIISEPAKTHSTGGNLIV